MNATDRELFRQTLLLQLDRGTEAGLVVSTLRIGAKHAGYEVDDAAVRKELAYLIDLGFVAIVGRPISPENIRYRITAPGRDYLAVQGLA